VRMLLTFHRVSVSQTASLLIALAYVVVRAAMYDTAA
jgi:hypothetical protein